MKLFFNRKPAENKTAETVTSQSPTQAGEAIDAEVAAAISVAIHMYMREALEYENAIVTIQKIMKPYSPWSSKIYGLRQEPNRIPGYRLVKK